MENTSEERARAAAEALIAAFARHDRDAYFSSFAPEASFIFHNVAEVLPSRAAYEALWASWEAEGFRVASCESSQATLRMVTDEVAVFTHNVRTRLAGVEQELLERETIVLRRAPEGQWLAVHEHLSPLSAQQRTAALSGDRREPAGSQL